ncbi:complement C1q tumor necrosis factor-related protein 4 [Brachyhypopomus gauderio]|uniref:complement C1q tumor necrosis factor-related protein 4 n=1 Tax=Brachyhypopomus gauderio TaxID=698409 RepID=UPI004042DA05
MHSLIHLRKGVGGRRSSGNMVYLSVILIYLDHAMSFHPVVMPTGPGSAFSATQSSSRVGGSLHVLTFDRLLVNVGGDFSPDTGYFRCRVPGVYYFTFTVGKYPKKLLSVMLVKNGREVQATAYNEYRKRGRKVQSQSVMSRLKATDTVWLLTQSSPDYGLYSTAAPYITFTGYLVYPESASSEGHLNNHLSPPQPRPECLYLEHPGYSWNQGDTGEVRSAFSVARTSPVLGENGSPDSKEALKFDVEYVNLGGHFNKSSGRFTCRFPGVYFFAFTVGKHPCRVVSVKLMTGSVTVQAMVFDEDTSNKRGMQSQSVLLPLERGDVVWLYSQQGERYGVYSNHGRYTTFTGFLLYPE